MVRRFANGRFRIGAALAALMLVAADAPARPPAPAFLASAPDGTLIIADLTRPGIVRRDAKGTLSLVAAGSSKPRTPLYAVTALAVASDGTVYAADRATSEVYRLKVGEAPAPLTKGALEIPTGLEVTASGDLLVCDLRLANVSRIPKGGGEPKELARVPAPRGIASGPDGAVVVLSMGPDQLVQVSGDGAVKPIVKGRPFRFPIALLRDPKHNRYLVSDSYASTVWEIPDGGEPRAWVKGSPLVRPEGLAIDSTGAVLVADPGAGQVFRVAAPDKIEPVLEKQVKP